MKISAIILTKNEEKNIKRCLLSLDFVDEVVIVDDFSSDKTIENAKKILKGRKHKIIKRHLNDDYSQQKNFALTKAENEWILSIDADEKVTEELKKEILEKIKNKDFLAYYIKRRDFIWGREVRFGEVLKARKKGFIRLFRKDYFFWQGQVHELLIAKKNFNLPKKISSFENYLDHFPHQNVKEFLKKINFYSRLRAKELLRQGKKTNVFQIIFYPIFKFIYTYFFLFGFLDGKAGFLYSFMMSFHSFLVRGKLYLDLIKNKK